MTSIASTFRSRPIDPLPKTGIYDAVLDNVIYERLGIPIGNNPDRKVSTIRLVFTVQLEDRVVEMCKLYSTPNDDDSAMRKDIHPWIANLPFKESTLPISELKGRACRVLITHHYCSEMHEVYADIVAVLPTEEDAARTIAKYREDPYLVVRDFPERLFLIVTPMMNSHLSQK